LAAELMTGVGIATLVPKAAVLSVSDSVVTATECLFDVVPRTAGSFSGRESDSANFSPFPVCEWNPADTAPGDRAVVETIDAKVPGVGPVVFEGPAPSAATVTGAV
jgi:hypothetical protein